MPHRRTKSRNTVLEDSLLADAGKLRGVELRRLGYYGGPARTGPVALAHALDNEELEPFYDTEAERAAAERQARLLAGCLWKCSSLLIAGLFDDVYELRSIEYENESPDLARLRAEFIAEDSAVLYRLPDVYAANYTAEVAQRFLVVAANMVTKLAGTWTPPSCLAEELAVHCLAEMVEAYGRTEGVGLDAAVESTLYEALLEDTDHLFMYPVPGFSEKLGVDPEEMVSILSATGLAELDFDTWFAPFNDEDRAVASFVHDAGAPARETDLDGYDDEEVEAEMEAEEAYAPGDRTAAIAAGDLVDVTEAAATIGFNCEVAFTREALAAVLGPEDLAPGGEVRDERVSDTLFSAVQAASSAPERRSATFFTPDPASGATGPIRLDVVAGSAEPGNVVVTIQPGRRSALH